LANISFYENAGGYVTGRTRTHPVRPADSGEKLAEAQRRRWAIIDETFNLGGT
jgi:hypothetical protein